MARAPVRGPLVIPNCVEVRLRFTCEGRTHSIVLHAIRQGTTTVDGVLAQTLFTAFTGTFTSSGYAGIVDPNATFASVGVKDLNSPNLVEFLSTGAGVVGTGTPPEMPAQVAIVVTHRTLQAGRAFRGRSYLGCLVQAAAQTSYTATTAADTAAAAFMNGIRTNMASSQLTFCVAQRALQAGTDKAGNVLAPRAANTVQIAQSVIVNPRFDTQRRRLGR